MGKSLIRGRHVIAKVIDRHTVEQHDDAAVLQEDGVIRAVGPFEDLRAAHPDAQVLGTGRQVVLPGFVNGHHHIGLTTVQLGSPDMPLELWFITRLVCRRVDLYLDTLYSAFEMLASGVTTVQHIHGWLPGTLKEVEAGAEEVLRAYDDVGMRASYSFALRDQNRLVYQDDADFTASLPLELRGPMAEHFARFKMGTDDFIALFETLHGRHHDEERIKVQLAPANLHWCSNEALERLALTAEKYDVPLHMHLLETPFQKEYARRRGGGTAVDYIERFGLLGPKMTLGHGVWLTEGDVEKLAASGTNICHNCSSNFRLRSGLAALNYWEAKGVNVAMGMDEAGINDDRDMLQEMRMVLNAHRTPGIGDAGEINSDVPTKAQVLRMATSGGAATTPFGASIGTIEVGKGADLVLIDLDKVAYPHLDRGTPVLDAVLHRAKTGHVDMTMCAGEVVYENGTFTKVDRVAALEALKADMDRALDDEEVGRRKLAGALYPHAHKFYADYVDPAAHRPFYKQSSRV